MFRFERSLSLGDVSTFLLVLIALGGLAYTHNSFLLAKAQHESQIHDIKLAFRGISDANEQFAPKSSSACNRLLKQSTRPSG